MRLEKNSDNELNSDERYVYYGGKRNFFIYYHNFLTIKKENIGFFYKDNLIRNIRIYRNHNSKKNKYYL